jgi:Zn-dependent M28 family amino/carboxypeptidase
MGGQELLDAWDSISDMLSQSEYVLKRKGESQLETQMIDVLLVKPEIGAALLQNQIYNPFSVKDDGKKTYKIFELQNVEFKIDVTEVREEIVTWNVVGLISGTDPAFRDQYVTVGAHLDHIPRQNGQVCNGADDNASGCAGVMEIAEAIAANPLKRPVIVTLWAAEEAGSHLMGSKFFLRNPPIELGKIKVNVTLDMIGLTTESEVKSKTHFVFGYANTLDEFRTIIDRVNGRTVRWPLEYGEDSSSDHASFQEKGIPAFFFCSGASDVTHTPGDDPEIMDYEKMVSIARLAYEVVCELGNSREFPINIK